MKLLYEHEHTSCYNYDKGAKPLIEKFILEKNQTTEINISEYKILIIKEGCVKLNNTVKKLEAGNLWLAEAQTVRLEACETSVIIIIRLRFRIQLCEHFSMDKLFGDMDIIVPDETSIRFLKANNIIHLYFEGLDKILDTGLRCALYLETKIKELFYFLRAYYTKEELYVFFSPMASRDEEFAGFVYNNYKKAKNIIELSKMANYSISGFGKRFKNTFGVTAGQWMKKQKAISIFHEINCSTKSLKEISYDYGFYSTSQLSKYCRHYFGQTPGMLRKTKIKRKV